MRLIKFGVLISALSLTTACVPVWDLEAQSLKLMESVADELEFQGYKVNPLEKGCGIGIDCNNPNYKLVAGKAPDADSHQNTCLSAIDIASNLGMTTWATSEDGSIPQNIETTKEEAIQTCDRLLSDVPKLEGDSGFAESDSESIEFYGGFDHEESAGPGQMSFRVNLQREDGESGEGTKTLVFMASTNFMQ